MDIKNVLSSSKNDINLSVSLDISQGAHTGFIFKNTNNEIKYLHLAFHNFLKYDEFDIKCYWVDIPIDNSNKIFFRLFLESIYYMNGSNIPYSIICDGSSFDASGQFTSANEYYGLTCATFVMEALNALDYNIIDTKGWSLTQEDKKAQEKLVDLLERYKLNLNISDEYIKVQKQNIGKVIRVDPYSVFIACSNKNTPMNQEQINKQKPILNKYIQNNSIL